MPVKLPRSKLLRFLIYAALASWLVVAALVLFVVWSRNNPNRADAIVGVALPRSIAGVHVADRMGFFGGDHYVSAVISHDDYQQLVSQLGLRYRADLLNYWPAALDAPGISWWTVSSVNDADTYFGDSENSAYIVTRYEGGRFYFRRQVY